MEGNGKSARVGNGKSGEGDDFIPAHPFTATPSLTTARGYPGPMGRPFSTITPIGQRCKEMNWEANDLCHATGIYARAMTEILAGRRTPRDHELAAIAEALECDPEDLL